MTDLLSFEQPWSQLDFPEDSDDESTIMGDQPAPGKDDVDIVAELESLSLLEAHASLLNAEIAARKKTIASQMKEHRQTLCLKHLLKECDGLICKAKAVAQRICDKVGIPVEPDYGYAEMKQQHIQHMVGLNEKQGYSEIPTGAGNVSHASHLQIMLTADGKSYGHGALDLSPKNPLIQALSIIAGVLGLSALFAFIKRRCMSVRRRVERAADREERMNARAYRRAARRAEMRRRWINFVDALNCFSAKEAPRNGDYDEKRALILQDAFLEQDLDQAEKGEVMEAEIRELRHAHEIVSSLVRVGSIATLCMTRRLASFHCLLVAREPAPETVCTPCLLTPPRACQTILPDRTTNTATPAPRVAASSTIAWILPQTAQRAAEHPHP